MVVFDSRKKKNGVSLDGHAKSHEPMLHTLVLSLTTHGFASINPLPFDVQDKIRVRIVRGLDLCWCLAKAVMAFAALARALLTGSPDHRSRELFRQ
jgi:hypothetical protein